jgi:hypothetical protein
MHFASPGATQTRSSPISVQMTREEAIAFLQDIKLNLEFLQNHYTQLQRNKEQQRQQVKVTAHRAKAAGAFPPDTHDEFMLRVSS